MRRSGSSDSAVGLTPSDEEPEPKKEDYKSIQSPYYSPRSSIDHSNVPSKTLIEAQYVPCPLDRKFSDCSECVDLDLKNNIDNSRRHSCFTDDGEEIPRCRYFRTPSVVVSDYSDDVIGLTLEDIEYFRSQRKENSSSPDSSLNSSCSNLNYCGSTISNLDAEYILRRPFRKSSDCSTCSTLSGDEDAENTLPVPAKDQVNLLLFFTVSYLINESSADTSIRHYILNNINNTLCFFFKCHQVSFRFCVVTDGFHPRNG